jgi:hypothetical protein
MENKFKFNTIFANLQLKPIVSEEKDKYLSVASLSALRKFLPQIDSEKNIDLLPVAFDACVVNRVNKNGDVINAQTAYEVAKYFINKPINIEHDRTRVVGCILNANFSKFGSNESLAELDVKDMKEPFNITLGGVIWKVVNQNLANLIEESNDPTSENYMGISASWELGFNDYNLVLLKDKEKNLENGKIVSSEQEKAKLSSNLKALGGSGRVNENTYIYREVTGEVVPLGIGLTVNPAADVEGVAVEQENNDEILKVEQNQSDIQISEEPVDQIVGMMLYYKLNAIMEGRMTVTRLDLSSILGDSVWYQHDEDDAWGPFREDGWWHEPTVQHDSILESVTADNVVRVIPNAWHELGLIWPEEETEPTANTVVFANFTKNEN